MVSVLNFKKHRVCLIPFIKSESILANNTDFGVLAAAIYFIPIHSCVFINRLVIKFAPGRAPICFWDGGPHSHRTGLIFYLPILIQKAWVRRAPSGPGCRCQKVSIISGKLGGKHISIGHALHKNPLFINIVFLLEIFQ